MHFVYFETDLTPLRDKYIFLFWLPFSDRHEDLWSHLFKKGLLDQLKLEVIVSHWYDLGYIPICGALQHFLFICSYLIVCVVDVLNEASDRGLHQYKECELPWKIHHKVDHAHCLDEGPEQHIDIQTHRLSHQVCVFRQPACDLTCPENDNKLVYLLFCSIVLLNLALFYRLSWVILLCLAWSISPVFYH